MEFRTYWLSLIVLQQCPGIAMSCCHGDRLHPLEHSSGNGPSNVSVSLCLDGTTQSCEQMEELLHQIESEGCVN